MKGKKVLSLLCAATMAATLLSGCGGTKTDSKKSGSAASTASKASTSVAKTSSAASNTGAPDTSQHVDITIGGLNLKDSEEANWPTDTVDLIEKKFNCSIKFKGYQKDSLNLDLSGENTTDIVQINEDNIDGVLRGKHAVNLEDYKAIAPNIFADALSFRNNVMKNFKSDDSKGQYVVTPHVTTDNVEETFGAILPFGYAVRWDLYKEIGAPAITNDDEYIAALKKMKEKYPKTESGEETYAYSIYNDAKLHAYFHKGCLTEGYVNLEGGLYVQNVKTNELVSDIYDVDEGGKVTPFWAGVKFYNKLYREGLLDPDAFITKGEDIQEKYSKGQYLGGQNNWYFGEYNSNERKKDPNTLKEFVLLPSYMGWANEPNKAGWSGKYYFVSSHSPNVERAVMVLDYLQSADASRETCSGVEGRWEVKDGKAVLKDDTKTIKSDGARADELKKSGIGENNMYNSIGYADNAVLADGGMVDLFMADDILADTLTAAQKDMCKTLKITLPSDLLKNGIAEGKNIDMRDTKSAIRMVIQAATKDINRIDGNVEEITVKALPSLVMAKTDAEFDAAKAKLMEDLKAANVEKSVNWWKENWNTAVNNLDNMK